MEQSEDTGHTELPIAETDGDVDEDEHQGSQHGPNGVAQQLAGDSGLDLGRRLDTTHIIGQMREVVFAQILFVIETFESGVEFVFALFVNFHIVAFDLIVGHDTDLVVATEGLDLGRAAELFDDRLTDVLRHHILVETHHIAAAAGEINAGLQTEGEEGDDGDNDQRTGKDVEDLSGLEEIEVGVGESVDRQRGANGEFFASLETVLDDHAGHENGGEQGGEDTDDQRGGETLDRTGTEDVEDESGDEGGDVTVDDSGVRILETLVNGHAHALAGAHLLTDTLVNNHVRVNGHT